MPWGSPRTKSKEPSNDPDQGGPRVGERTYKRKRETNEQDDVTDDHEEATGSGGVPTLVSGGSIPFSSSAPANGHRGLSDRYACGKKRTKRDPDQATDLTSELPDHIGVGYRTYSGDATYRRSLLRCRACGQVGGALYRQFVKNHSACELGEGERPPQRGNLTNEEKMMIEDHIGAGDSRAHKRRRAQAAAVMMVDTWD